MNKLIAMMLVVLIFTGGLGTVFYYYDKDAGEAGEEPYKGNGLTPEDMIKLDDDVKEKWRNYSEQVDTPEIITIDPGIARAVKGPDLKQLAELEGKDEFNDSQSDVDNAQNGGGDYGDGGNDDDEVDSGAPREELAADESDKSSNDDTPSREVEEADIIKVIGDHIYVLNQYRGLSVIDISNPENAELKGQCSVVGYPEEMYVVDFLAIVTVRTDYSFWYRYWELEGGDDGAGAIGTMIYIINVADPSDPVILKIVEVEGYAGESRRVGNVLYQTTNNYGMYGYYDDDWEPQTIVTSIDFGDPETVGMKDRVTFSGNSNQVHASWRAFYVAQHDYFYNDYDIWDILFPDEKEGEVEFEEREEPVDPDDEPMEGNVSGGSSSGSNDAVAVDYDDDEKGSTRSEDKRPDSMWEYPYQDTYEYYTRFTYLDITDPAGDIEIRDEFVIPGEVTNKYQMDEFEDTFRMVSHFWRGMGQSRLYIVDISNPNKIQPMGDLLIDDEGSLMATRFAGERGYTIHLPRAIDPLDVLDLSDPNDPKLCDVFEMPGWVTHMEVRGFKIIALGVDDSGNQTNVAVSLFDVTDPYNVVMEERVRLGGDYAYSEANWEPKALTVDDTHDIVIVPYSSWDRDEGHITGIQIVKFDLEEGDLELKGSVHGKYTMERTRVVDDYILATSFKGMYVVDIEDLDTPEMVKTIDLCTDIQDVLYIDDGIYLQIINDDQNYVTEVRTVSSPSDLVYIDRVPLEAYGGTLFEVNGNLILALNIRTNDTDVNGVLYSLDVTEEGLIQLEQVARMPAGIHFGANYNNYYDYYGYAEDDVMVEKGRSEPYYYYPIYNLETRFAVVEDNLVFYNVGEHVYSSWRYDESIDEYRPYPEKKGNDTLYIFDLSDLEDVPEPTAFEMDSYSFRIMKVLGSELFIQHVQTNYEPVYRYDYVYYDSVYQNYVKVMDLSDPLSPSAVNDYSVPGELVGVADGVIFTVSRWYDGQSNATLNTLERTNDTAVLVSALDLGDTWVDVRIVGDKAYLLEGPDYYYYWDYKYGGQEIELNTTLTVLDLSIPADPSVLVTFEFLGDLNLQEVDENHMVLRDYSEDKLYVYSTSTLPETQFESMILLRGSVSNTRIYTDRIILARGYYGATEALLQPGPQ